MKTLFPVFLSTIMLSSNFASGFQVAPVSTQRISRYVSEFHRSSRCEIDKCESLNHFKLKAKQKAEDDQKPTLDNMLNGNPYNVPRLPIPSLENTIERYLTQVKSHAANSKEWEEHKALVEDFAQTVGPEMHQKLVAQDEANKAKGCYPHSYIEELWSNMYDEGRWELPINMNPAFTLVKVEEFQGNPQLERCAKFTRSWLKLIEKIKSGNLEKPRPLECVYQYPLQIGAARIPKVGQADLREHDPHSQHIVVLHKNNFYKLPVFDGEGGVITLDDLKAKLERIVQMSKDAPEVPFVGIFTSADRDSWGAQRSKLLESSVNVQTIKDIDTAAFVLCIDDEVPADLEREAALMLHGDNGLNRWFDKHNLISLGNGEVGVTFEHSYSDGSTWNRMLHEAWCDAHDLKPPRGVLPFEVKDADSLADPELLTWDLSQPISEAIAETLQKVKGNCDNLQISVLDFQEFGKKGFMKMKANPDATLQLAFQLVYNRLHEGEVAGIYEACSMGSFFHGRTETIRSLTPKAKRFLDVMGDPNSQKEDKVEAFRAATSAHADTGDLARTGQGIDRHFKALRSFGHHPLFESKLFQKSSKWLLSTSNVSIASNRSLTFGPVELHGYGLGYVVHDKWLCVHISNFKSSEKTDSVNFRRKLSDVLLELQDLCLP